MKENRLAQNNEILHKTWQFQRIPHYNDQKHSYRNMGTLEAIYSIRTRLFAVELSRTY
ncbi:hypothetical protein T08_4087 [Trichinella sp. T8]|nr:hypothetical protein T08_2289 [Trichinella sp. T8]KRZ81415.1 hypothetical protein T08_5885 [Trichinella sp. T8]KRZ81416.1 hypothetical protein T08_4087 [Trichinella sp. T8]